MRQKNQRDALKQLQNLHAGYTAEQLNSLVKEAGLTIDTANIDINKGERYAVIAYETLAEERGAKFFSSLEDAQMWVEANVDKSREYFIKDYMGRYKSSLPNVLAGHIRVNGRKGVVIFNERKTHPGKEGLYYPCKFSFLKL